MDRTECPLVEMAPGRLSGAPVILHCRIWPGDLVQNQEQGAQRLAGAHDLPLQTVASILALHEQRARRSAPAV